jgi:lysozyme family protein
MFPKMRNFLQVVLTTTVMLAGAAQAQTPPVAVTAANATVTNAANSTAQQSAVGTQGGVATDVSAAPALNAVSPDKSSFSVVPQVGIWTLLAAMAGLMLMRIWLSNKRKLSTIR